VGEEPDRVAATAPARAAFLARFIRKVEAMGFTDPVEIHRRAEMLHRAYMLDLARRSAIARRAHSRRK
jgi:hypothetical protein